ncbi:MAG TPA: PQQ-dependent sugar dehydrogenase, partial [Phototrophicaceae bacterium]|nr:PQQ-dependent sugar dehydrogenase [Phototrophicaceae bacterium]
MLFVYKSDEASAVPVVKDSDFKIEMIVNGLTRPTGFTFLAPNDFLVIEEDTGKVKRVIDGQVVKTVLDLGVSTSDSRGLLGIDSFVDNNQIFVFLYFTASSSGDGGSADGNRLYRYELIDNELVNPKILLNLPSGPGPKDNGGPVVIGPDRNVYFVIGHIAGDGDIGHQTKAQNYKTGPNADGTSGIHRVTQDGSTVGSGILGSTKPLSTYYAYGIRNSFGMDFDPVTGKLWSTENGPSFGDEINLVEGGFNGGWNDVMGLTPSGFNHNGLETFGGKGKYSDPEFVWKNVVSPTDLVFFNSGNFGSEFRNDMFVGDFEFGRIYHFNLNSERNSLSLIGSLADKEADSDSELQSVVFAEGLGVPTDMDVGPDGNLYVSSLRDGAIYKVSKSDENSETTNLDINGDSSSLPPTSMSSPGNGFANTDSTSPPADNPPTSMSSPGNGFANTDS